ncbi:MAG: histidine kinase [Alphaproteobacteria bacterium]|nr:MAG: histidine kinase [Alphaproteobacteria bacterium]
MLVKTVLDKKGFDVFSVLPEDTILTVLKIFSIKKIGFSIVGDPLSNIEGTVSERDICQALAGGAHRDTIIKDVMTLDFATCSLEDNLAKVMALMTEHRTRHVLVYNGTDIRGIISIGDVVKHRLDETLRDEVAMRQYIEGTGYSYLAETKLYPEEQE